MKLEKTMNKRSHLHMNLFPGQCGWFDIALNLNTTVATVSITKNSQINVIPSQYSTSALTPWPKKNLDV